MELYIAVEQSLLSKVPQQPLNNQPGVFKTASLGISWHHYMWTCEPSNNPTEKVDIPPRFPSTFGNLWNSKMYPDPTSSPLFNPSVRNFSFEEMGRQKCWKSLVPFTHPPNPPRNCTVNSLSFKKTWHRPRVEAAMSSRSTRHIRNCEKVRLHKTWIIQKQFSDVHCFTESLIQFFHHQQANNTIHLHKTLTCLFLDSEWVCKGWKNLMHLDSISTLLISDRSWRAKIYSTTTPSIIHECQCSFTCPYIQCKQSRL